MKNSRIPVVYFLIAIAALAVLFMLGSLASAGNDNEQDWPYNTNTQERYMELHLRSDGSDYLTHMIEAEHNSNHKGTTLDKVNDVTQAGGGWAPVGQWTSDDLFKDITASRDAGGEFSDQYDVDFSLFFASEDDQGGTHDVQIRVSIDPLSPGWVESELLNLNYHNDDPDNYIEFKFGFSFTDVNVAEGNSITINIEASTQEEYSQLNGDDSTEDIDMLYGTPGKDSFLNFEANTVEIDVEKDDVTEEIKIKDINGIAYANVSFIHAFGKDLVNQDKPFYIRIYGPANESKPEDTIWENTISWNETIQYVGKEYDLVGESTIPVIWQIQEDKQKPGTRSQLAPSGKYFLYFKGWDIYNVTDNNGNLRVCEANTTFKVPTFSNAEERIELEWATGDIYFYNENGQRFDPNDDDLKGIAQGDSIFVNSTFKIGGGSNSSKYYNGIEITVAIKDLDGFDIYNESTVLTAIKGGSYPKFQTPRAWIPEEVGEDYTVDLWINMDETVKEYNYTNNHIRLVINVYENRRPIAVISHPLETNEGVSETYQLVGQFITFDATNSTDPDTPYNQLNFEWEITDLKNEWTRDIDIFTEQLPAGSYSVTLTVDDGIRSSTRSIFIEVNTAPRPSSGNNGIAEPEDEAYYSKEETIRFVALYTDADSDTLYYTWRSDEKGVIGSSDSLTNSVEVEAEELSSGGKNVHNITVTVKDMHGGVHVSEVIIYINELPRIVIFEPEDGSSFGSGEEVSFDASLSSDAEDGTSDYLYFVWYYDDGSGPQPFGQGAISSRTFRTTGDYVVTVEVTDSAGGMSEKSISININSKPIAEIGNVKGSGKELTFDGSGSSDPDGKDIDRYVWDMDLSFDSDGDGEADNDRDAEGVSPTFKFNDTGTYNIQLTVMDEDGVWSDPVTLEVKVKEEEDDALPPAMIFMSVALAALVMSIQRKRR